MSPQALESPAVSGAVQGGAEGVTKPDQNANPVTGAARDAGTGAVRGAATGAAQGGAAGAAKGVTSGIRARDED